jgi:hypothetical protein
MANIPHSSRYRTPGSKGSSHPAVPNRTGPTRRCRDATDWTTNQPPSTNWLTWVIGLLALGLLVAFPLQVLGAIGFGLLLFRLFGKK